MQYTLPHAGAVHLRDVFPDSYFFGGDNVAVTSCCGDAKACQPGDLFVALETPDSDGHGHAFQAVARGACAVLAERPLPVGVPVCVVDDTREAYGQICQRLLGSPAKNMQLIGVTGTSGKTTTAALLRSVLLAANRLTGITSTLGYNDGYETAVATQTTPQPPQMAKWLARMAANGCSHAVIEATSEALAQRRLSGVELDAAILTNVRRDHLDVHNTIQNYRKAKLRIFNHLKPEGFAIVNADDPTSNAMLDSIDHPTLTIGMHSPAEITATMIERHRSEQTFLLTAGHDTIPVRTRMIGDHHVYNCLAAAAVGFVLNIDLTTIVRGLEQLESVPGRLERIECGQPFSMFVDYARTPDSLAASLKALKQVTSGRLFCIFGADADRDPSMRPLVGHTVERHADVSVITSDNPRCEEPLRIAHDILDGFDKPGRARVMPNRLRAIRWALAEAKHGDTVLVAGKGNETTQTIDGTTHHFDDRAIARDWLYNVGAQIEYPPAKPRLKIFDPTA